MRGGEGERGNAQKGASSPVGSCAWSLRRGDGRRRPNRVGRARPGADKVEDAGVDSACPRPIPCSRRERRRRRTLPSASIRAGRTGATTASLENERRWRSSGGERVQDEGEQRERKRTGGRWGSSSTSRPLPGEGGRRHGRGQLGGMAPVPPALWRREREGKETREKPLGIF